MSSRKLSSFTAGINPTRIVGSGDPIVRGLAYDSRVVEPGYLFYALDGLHTDGHLYIDQAIARGAVAVIHSRPLSGYRAGIVYLQVDGPRSSMSPTAASFYERPSERLAVVGVTGTEGKSTSVYLIYQLLDLAGYPTGFFSTVTSRTGPEEVANSEHQTTPEAPAVQRMLAEMVDSGLEYAIIESSSHGLSPRTNRLADVAFDVAVMTNVTHEHLEFHGSWEQYRDDKANLFRALDRSEKAATHRKRIAGREREVPAFGVANADDPSAGFFARATARPVYTYSASGGAADLRALEIRADREGADFLLAESEARWRARINLPGTFNVANTLASLLVVSRMTARPLADFVPLLPDLRPVRGRMTRLDRGQPFDLLVDYAHTPSSFEAILPAARAQTKGRLIALFGSAGERDVEKRRLQGEIADRFCDIILLADEDPRGEEPTAILEEIAHAITGKVNGESLFLIPDRLEAIRAATRLARAGDTLLLLGKGHESSIIYRSGAIAWDEIGAAQRCLAELGYTG